MDSQGAGNAGAPVKEGGGGGVARGHPAKNAGALGLDGRQDGGPINPAEGVGEVDLETHRIGVGGEEGPGGMDGNLGTPFDPHP